MKTSKPFSRLMAMLLSLVLVLGTLPITVSAEVTPPLGQSNCTHVHGECSFVEGVACEHAHDETCGFTEAVPCGHIHDETCGENGVDCTHTHDEACGFVAATDCTHAHDESCGFVQAVACDHVHDATCGGLVAEPAPLATPVVITAFDQPPYHNPSDLGTTYIVVDKGTAIADIPLPTTLMATVENGIEYAYSVAVSEWTCATYDPQTPEVYVFVPTLALKANESLKDGITAPTVEVVVSANVGIAPTAADVWNGTDIAAGYANGSGTSVAPYEISTGAQLAYLAQQVNEGEPYAGMFFKLTADIDLNSMEWTPIGNNLKMFKGTFDGNHKTISNLKITGSSYYLGLFGYVEDGKVSNLGLVNVDISGVAYVGGVVGYLKKSIGNSSIENCFVSGTITGTSDSIGGIVGYVDSGTVQNCYSKMNVTGRNNVGGIAGRLENLAAVSVCYTTGTVKATTDVAGGIVGWFGSGTTAANCVALNQSVTGSTGNTGRVIGRASGTTTDNYAWKNMVVTLGGNVYQNGTAKTADELKLANGWQSAFTTATTTWSCSDGKLPILTSFDSLAQDSTFPTYIVAAEYPVLGGGTGELSTPYLINSITDLTSFRNAVNMGLDYSGKTIQLNSDLNLTGIPNWTSIGTLDTPFKGTFDGNHKTISNLKITGSSGYRGFFGYVEDGKVRNLGLVNVDIYGNNFVGGVVGYLKETSVTSSIENCFVSGSISATSGTAVGGIVGNADGGTVKNCYSNASVTGYTNVGGIAGRLINTATVSTCYATGAISANATSGTAGGIVGWLDSGTTTNCVALNQSVTGGTGNTGRVIGHAIGTTTDNFAWQIMEGTWADGNVYQNGTAKTADELKLAAGWQSAFTTATTTWTYVVGKLPILTSFDSLAQDSTFPTYMVAAEYPVLGGGTGELSTPYLITSITDLTSFRSAVNMGLDYSGKTIQLNSDLNLTDIPNWTSIGTLDTPFKGTFDGNHKTISNLKITGSSGYRGLFGYVEDGKARNLGLVNVDISGNNSVGGVVGCLKKSSGNSSIENCFVSGSISATSGNAVGGIVGNANGGTVQNCYSNASVTGNTNVGGIAGAIINTASVSTCYATGTVNANTIDGVAGGIVGLLQSGTTAANCVALNQSVTGSTGNTGRVIGRASGTTTDNYAWKNMVVTLGGNVYQNGTAKTADELKLANGWQSAFTTATTTWSCSDGKLPILTSFDSLAQDSTFPDYLTDTVYTYPVLGIGNDGSLGKPYVITSVTDLISFRDAVNHGLNYSGLNIQLSESLDLSSIDNWAHIGTLETLFKGTFDGNHKTISNLKITGLSGYWGLFGYVEDGNVRNLGLVNVDISGRDFVGGVVGYLSKTGSNTALIENCFVSGSISAATGNAAGGIVGHVDGGTVQNCYSNASMTGNTNVGGIAGAIINTASVSTCYATGTVNANTIDGVAGGIVGLLQSGTTAANCVALNQSVTGGAGYVGRVIGRAVGTPTDNYAWAGMLVNTASVSTGTGAYTNHGENKTATDLSTETTWSNFTTGNGWTYFSEGLLPVFTGTTQDRNFPAHIPIVPGAPTIGTATAGDASASVTFTAPTRTGSTPISTYAVTSDPSGGTGTGQTSPIIVTGLTIGTPYTFTVTATNSSGTGSASAASVAVTPTGISGISAASTTLAYTGGSNTITVSGTGLSGGIKVTAFDGATATAITGTTTGTGTNQTVGLTFPTNTLTTDKVYTIKASLDGGTTWSTQTTTVTVARVYTTTITISLVNSTTPNTGTVTNPANVGEGATVTLPTVTAKTGFTFSTWTVTAGGVTITNPTSAAGATFPMGTADVAITATFIATPLTFNAKTLTSGTYDTAYSANVTPATGGSGNYTYSATGLPSGLSMSTTGAITGTPTAAVTAQSITVTATDTISGAIANATYTLTIANASQAAPTGVGKTDETIVGLSNGKLTGVSTLMEYKLTTDGGYTLGTGSDITGLQSGTYYVRYAAKTNYNAGTDATFTIAQGEPVSYTLTATAPTFTTITYGDSQPVAQSITITSTGNTAATITSVTLTSGDTGSFTIGGSGGTVSADGNITTWTVQPNDNLAAKTHTATITVTYSGGNTATASVSIVVNKAQITITPTAGQSKKYGTVDPTFTYSSSPSLVSGNSFTGTLSRATGENVDAYAYTLGSLSAGNNYTLTLDGANKFEIQQATVTNIDTIVSGLTKTAFEAKGAGTTNAIATLVGLPTNVSVTTDGGTATLPITWATSDGYDAKGKDYTFIGTLTGGTNIANGSVTKTVTITISPVTASNPDFTDTLAVIKDNETAATASELGVAILPTSGNIVVNGVSVAYTITWGSENLDRTMVGNNTTFTGVVSYTNVPAWLTIPTLNTISRKVTVTNKTEVIISGITANTNLDYSKTPKDVSKTGATAGGAGTSGLSYEYEGTNGTPYNASSTASSNAGNYTCTVSLTDSDYFATPIVINFTIAKLQLTAWDGTGVTVTTKDYDGNTNATIAGTLGVSGIISGDTVDVTGGSMSGVYNSATSGLTKTVIITPTGYSTSNDNYLLPTSSTTFTKTGDIIGLNFTGSVTISNTAPKVGDVLTANVAETSTAGNFTYSWNGAGTAKTGSTYTVVAADVGNTLTVEIGTSNPNYMGTFSSTATAVVKASTTPTTPINPGGTTSGSNSSSSSSSKYETIMPAPTTTIVPNGTTTTTIQNAISSGKNPIININGANIGADLTGKDLLTAAAKHKSILVRNGGVTVSITPQMVTTWNVKDDSKVQIILTPSTTAINTTLNTKLTGIDKLNDKLVKQIYDVTVSVNKIAVGKASTPMKVTIDVSALNLTEAQKAKFTGVIYNADLKTYKQLGGKFSVEGNDFTFYTYSTGKYGAIVSDKLTKMQLTIGNKSYTVNGKTLKNDVSPVISNGRTMLPIRAIAEALGAEVIWDPKRQVVVIKKDGVTIEIPLNQPLPNGMGEAFLQNGRMYVPVRYIAEMLGANVVWDEKDKTVDIYQ